MSGHHASKNVRVLAGYIISHIGSDREFSSDMLPAELRTSIGYLSMSGRAKCNRTQNGTKYYRLTQNGITYGKRWAVSEGV